VGGAETKLVLTEKVVARLKMEGNRRLHQALAVLAPADPLVLCSDMVIPDKEQRDAFSRVIAGTLASSLSSSF